MWVTASELMEQGKADKVNATLAHCIAAVVKKGKKTRDAWNICRASQVKSKHLKPPYKRAGKVADLQMTAKGTRAADKHSSDRGGKRKTAEFKRAFRKIEPTV